jgi:hypothetical protein
MKYSNEDAMSEPRRKTMVYSMGSPSVFIILRAFVVGEGPG